MDGKLLLNRWQTPDGTVLTSFHTHDYVTHNDKNGEMYFVDGGCEYVRMSLNKEKMKNMCVYTNSPYSDIRNTIRRGTFSKDGKRIWIPICNMSSPHLENCITYVMNHGDWKNNPHVFLYMKELVVRWEAGVYIPEKEYTDDDAYDGTGDVPQSVRICQDTINCTADEALAAFEANITAGLHADNEAVVVLLKHILGLQTWRDSLQKCKNEENKNNL